MAASMLVFPEEYLAASYEPDREYVDGRLEERHLGEHDHSLLQALIAAFFVARQSEHNIRVFTGQRLLVSNDADRRRYRIPDVCAVRRPYLKEPVLTHPPLLVAEILSRDDHTTDTLTKIREYVDFGVPHIWIVDPVQRRVFDAGGSGIREAPNGVLELSQIGLFVDFGCFFGELDLA
ncbi:MAG: Uma2 family endonuclease [Bryobacteraceae bacterium]